MILLNFVLVITLSPRAVEMWRIRGWTPQPKVHLWRPLPVWWRDWRDGGLSPLPSVRLSQCERPWELPLCPPWRVFCQRGRGQEVRGQPSAPVTGVSDRQWRPGLEVQELPLCSLAVREGLKKTRGKIIFWRKSRMENSHFFLNLPF